MRIRNAVLLAASLIFYAWAQPVTLPVILVVICINFYLAKKLEHSNSLRMLWTAVALNLAILVLFKVCSSNWLTLVAFSRQSLNLPLPQQTEGYLQKWAVFPLGLSFVSFQVIAHLIDIYKKRCPAEKQPGRYALLVLLFPKMVAGPIARFRELDLQLDDRPFSLATFTAGMRRFIPGLAKKAIIADTLGRIVDGGVFAQALPNLTAYSAWLVLICYTMQIYFDFAGYTDMALGMGQVFGFRLPENFNSPYAARGISDFWRRWHISLSSWFRDYVFYPLERSRRRKNPAWQYINILIVFALTGLWHGLTLNFLAWGALHGAAVALESGPFGRWLRSRWAPLQHFYTLAVLMIGWVFFRSPSLPFAFRYLLTLAGLQHGSGSLPYSMLPPQEASLWLALGLGVFFSLPVKLALKKLIERQPRLTILQGVFGDLALVALLLVVLVWSSGSVYQPYIYGNF